MSTERDRPVPVRSLSHSSLVSGWPASARYGRIAWVPGGVMDLDVIDNPDKARFEVLADGELGGFFLCFVRGDEIAFTHTQTEHREYADLIPEDRRQQFGL